jgi:serine/threonine-protein kinase
MIDTDRKITIDGTLLGTPDYMSPEQARGEGNVDARTDIWSLCVVLYEAITGARPFDGNNYNALLWAICHEAPKSLASHGAGDDRLWSILRTGLEKDREARWGSMRQLGVALAQWLLRCGINEDVCGFSLRSTWLAQDGRVALSEAPPADSLRSDRDAQPATEFGAGPATGVFERPPAEAGRWKAPLGYWLVGGATALALASGLGLALALMAGPRASSESGAITPIDKPVSPVVVEPRTTPRTLAPAASPPLAVAPSASAGASATPSGSAPASAPTHRPRRPAERRLDPDTYDFGF